MYRLNKLVLLFFILLQFGTTYILKEGGVEIARWTEDDGRDETEVINAETEPTEDLVEPDPVPGSVPATDPLEDSYIPEAPATSFTGLDNLPPAEGTYVEDPAIIESDFEEAMDFDFTSEPEPASVELDSLLEDVNEVIGEEEATPVKNSVTQSEPEFSQDKINARMKQLAMEESMIKEMTQTRPSARKKTRNYLDSNYVPQQSYKKKKPPIVEPEPIQERKVQEVPSVFKTKVSKEPEESLFEVAEEVSLKGPGYTKSWEENESGYKNAMRAQELTGEPILLYFCSTDSPYCKRFDRDVLSKKETQEFLTDISKVKIESHEHKKLHDQYHVKDFPTILIQLKSGKVIPVHERSNPGFFIREIKKAIA